MKMSIYSSGRYSLPDHSWLQIAGFILLLTLSGQGLAAKCLYVSSYHQGYEWNDGIERGLESVLKGKCKLDKFYMDTKRNQDDSFGKKQGLAAKEYILSTKPDIVIAADDNASRFLVKPYFRNAKIPFVFCGVNWTVDAYGYPYTNATGMIEVAPIAQTLKAIQDIVKTPLQGVYLSSDVFTEHKDFERYRAIFAEQSVELSGIFVNSLKDWKESYSKAQNDDFIILGNNAGINDWEHKEVIQYVMGQSKILSMTNYDWMMPYAMFAITKQADEQGEWAGQVALAILDKMVISNIPIVVNRRTNMYINPALVKSVGIPFPPDLFHKAVKVGQ
jgi:ABC-type uncharacterized transport system substrate-binding protein